jgi:hypothetical protein
MICTQPPSLSRLRCPSKRRGREVREEKTYQDQPEPRVMNSHPRLYPVEIIVYHSSRIIVFRSYWLLYSHGTHSGLYRYATRQSYIFGPLLRRRRRCRRTGVANVLNPPGLWFSKNEGDRLWSNPTRYRATTAHQLLLRRVMSCFMSIGWDRENVHPPKEYPIYR